MRKAKSLARYFSSKVIAIQVIKSCEKVIWRIIEDARSKYIVVLAMDKIFIKPGWDKFLKNRIVNNLNHIIEIKRGKTVPNTDDIFLIFQEEKILCLPLYGLIQTQADFGNNNNILFAYNYQNKDAVSKKNKVEDFYIKNLFCALKDINIDNERLEYIKCDYCGKDKPELMFVAKDLYNGIEGIFAVVRCKECGLVYTNPRPTQDTLKEFYPDSAGYYTVSGQNIGIKGFRKHLQNLLLSLFKGYKHLYKLKYPQLLKLLFYPLYILIQKRWDIDGVPEYTKGGKILEIGPSYGLFLSKLKDWGWEVTGMN